MCLTREYIYIRQFYLTVQILFLGVRGRDIRGDIAVDTLNVRSGQCEGRVNILFLDCDVMIQTC